MLVVKETWSVIDKWWKPRSEWINREFAFVQWNGRTLTFYREAPDEVWRIYKTGER